MRKIEVCANSIQSAIVAQEAGATRVELCDNMLEGGTTPSLGQIEIARNLLNIELYPIIRPRGGDFTYNEIDFLIMKKDIIHCGTTNCNGISTGILTPHGEIDKQRCKELVELAHSYNMKITFHRAIDRCKNILQALEDIIEIGFDRILTSGGKSTATEGKEVIKEMIKQANGRISIMPGSGITPQNIQEFAKFTKATEFHGTFSTKTASIVANKNTAIKDKNEFTYSNYNLIKEALNELNF